MEYCDITFMYVNLPGGFFLACGPEVHGRRSLGSHKPVSGSHLERRKNAKVFQVLTGKEEGTEGGP